MKKSFWGPKMHFSFFDFYHKISYGENDFVAQINIIESDITQNRTKTFFLVLQIKDFQLNQKFQVVVVQS